VVPDLQPFHRKSDLACWSRHERMLAEMVSLFI
jgi:hypothetical protein